MLSIETYAPINVLKPVGEEIWIVDGPIIRFRWLGIRLPFPTRMTVVRLASGDLWVHSPTEPEPALLAAMAKLGPVRHLVSPNKIHYAWIGAWQRAFPEARSYGMADAAGTAGPAGIVFERTLSAEPDAAWAGEIDQVLVPGGYLNEAVFFHRRSRSLILADLIENFEAKRIPDRILRFLVWATGALDPDGKMPFDLRITFFRHRSAVRRAVETMIGWEPERIILAHGRWYAKDAVAELRRAFRWTGLAAPRAP